MPNPFDQFDTAPTAPAPVVVGIPRAKEPPPVRPIVEELDRAHIENTRTQTANTAFDNERNLRQEFEKLLPVQNYRALVQPAVSALHAADTQAGDLQIVYAFGKVMDPGSVVREGEVQMAQDTGGVSERIKGYLAGLKGNGRLTPDVRQALIREIRTRAINADESYNQVRQQYRRLAQAHGIDPERIIGPHAGLPFQQQEADYLDRPVKNLDGSVGPAPSAGAGGGGSMPAPPPGDYRQDVGVFGNERSDPDPLKMSPERLAAWDASLAQMQAAFDHGDSRDQLIARAKGLGIPVDDVWLSNLNRAISDRAKGGKVQWVRDPRSFAPPPPDISDVRGEGAHRMSTIPVGAASFIIGAAAGPEKADAFNRGAWDTPLMGLHDEGAAAINTVLNGGTMDENLRHQRAVDDYDTEHSFGTRLAGQLVGGLALPMGEVSGVGNLALKGGAYGFGYGVGSGRGNVGDRLASGVRGGVAGASGSAVVGVGGQLAGKAVNALLPRVIGEAPPEAANVLAAAERQNVPLNVGDVRPGTRNALATLESMPGSSGTINRNIAAGRDAMANRVAELGGSGTALDDVAAGQTVQDAGRRTIEATGRKANRLYDLARSLHDNSPIPAPQANAALDGYIVELSQTPNANKALLGLLTDLKQDLSKPLTIDALRSIRTNMRGEIGNRNLTASNADRIIADVMDSASQDIRAGLTGNPKALQAFERADSFYRERQTYINDVLKRFLGPRDRPMSAEATAKALRSMAGGDARRFSEMMRSLDPQERADMTATFAAQLGRRSTDEPFSPALFLRSVDKISGPVRRELFGKDGAEALSDLITLATAKQATVGRLNNSASGRVMNYRMMIGNILGGGAPLGGATAFGLAGGSPVTGAAIGTTAAVTGVAINRALAKAFTNPKFVRLLAQAPATTSPRAIDAHIGKLRQLAARDPNVRSAVEAIERSLLNFANDNARLGTAAASNSSSDQPGQQ